MTKEITLEAIVKQPTDENESIKMTATIHRHKGYCVVVYLYFYPRETVPVTKSYDMSIDEVKLAAMNFINNRGVIRWTKAA